MFFKDVIGQDTAKQQLIQEVREGRIPHAQLFCGPAGVEVTVVAFALAEGNVDIDAKGVGHKDHSNPA